MERLTDKLRSRCDFCDAVADEDCPYDGHDPVCMDAKRYERLDLIEDILGDTYDLDSLRKLIEADREGRCVVLPCKAGETVYQVDAERVYGLKIKKIIYDCGHIAFDDTAIGKTVFLTHEAAEAALKGDRNV